VATPGPSVACVPNAPKTPKHGVRVPDELWQAVKRAAADRGETITDVIIRALKRYLRDYPDA
jgi:hypothetical protein